MQHTVRMRTEVAAVATRVQQESIEASSECQGKIQPLTNLYDWRGSRPGHFEVDVWQKQKFDDDLLPRMHAPFTRTVAAFLEQWLGAARIQFCFGRA